jgi:hypothetical protein
MNKYYKYGLSFLIPIVGVYIAIIMLMESPPQINKRTTEEYIEKIILIYDILCYSLLGMGFYILALFCILF